MRLFKKRQFNNYVIKKKSKKNKLLIVFLVILIGLLLIFKQKYRYQDKEQITLIRPNTFEIDETEKTKNIKSANSSQIIDKTNSTKDNLAKKVERPLLELDSLIPVE